ncbi:hypothetical protein [Nocardia fluminea]|uniref:hypothetical protein n=1 Tax=Nocardia fluminea TaxID=134984 RepID=UPI00364E9E90
MTPAAAARAYNRILAGRALDSAGQSISAAQFVNDKGPTQPGVNPEWKPPTDKKPPEQPGVTTPAPPQPVVTTPGPTQVPAPALSPQQKPAQVAPQPPADEIPTRIDPELVATVPMLASTYNPDGTLKSNEQLGAEQSAVDMLGLPAVLAENRNGTTPLPGGGNIDKSIYVDSEGWHVETTVNLSDGTTVQLNGSGVDVEPLPNGRSATTMSYGQANSDVRDELARLRQAVLSGSQGEIPPGSSPLASGIKHAGDAEQVIGALDLLLASPTAPVRIIKDSSGKIISLSVLNMEGGEHIVVLNSGVNSFDQQNANNFEFYRDANGVIRAPGGGRIIEIDDQFVLVDNTGKVIPTKNADVGDARIFDPATNPTGYTHGVPGGSSPSPFGYPALAQSGSEREGPQLSVKMPNEPGTLRALTEIPIPAGLLADKAYRVSGGGIVVVDQNGAHWATDPGSPPTSEEIVQAVTEEIFWLAVGEGVGYAAFRVGAKVVPKILGRPGNKLDDTIGPEGVSVQGGAGSRGQQHAADEVLEEANIPRHTADASAEPAPRIPPRNQVSGQTEAEPRGVRANQTGVHTAEAEVSAVGSAPTSKIAAPSSSLPDGSGSPRPAGNGTGWGSAGEVGAEVPLRPKEGGHSGRDSTNSYNTSISSEADRRAEVARILGPNSDRVTDLDDWFTFHLPRSDAQFLHSLNEVREISRRLAVDRGATVRSHLESSAPKNAKGEPLKEFDLEVTPTGGGRPIKVEVTTADKPFESVDVVRAGVKHGTIKIMSRVKTTDPMERPLEVVIYGSTGARKRTAKGVITEWDTDGTVTRTLLNGKELGRFNVFEKLLDELKDDMPPGVKYLDRVVVIDRRGSILAEYKNGDSGWLLLYRSKPDKAGE